MGIHLSPGIPMKVPLHTIPQMQTSHFPLKHTTTSYLTGKLIHIFSTFHSRFLREPDWY